MRNKLIEVAEHQIGEMICNKIVKNFWYRESVAEIEFTDGTFVRFDVMVDNHYKNGLVVALYWDKEKEAGYPNYK